MTTTEGNTLGDLEEWLASNWDPQLTLRQWWARLAESGWSQPHWPVEWYGKGLSRAAANEAVRIIREFGAVTAPVGFGTGMAGPTLLVYGSDEQKAHHLPKMVAGIDCYCQLFSEPNAGSDLAGLQTRAIITGTGRTILVNLVFRDTGLAQSVALQVERLRAIGL